MTERDDRPTRHGATQPEEERANERLTLRLAPAIKRALQRRAEARGQTVSSVVTTWMQSTRRCEVVDCGSRSVVAVVRQGKHGAIPGAEHYACRACALDARHHGLAVVTLEDDSVEWEP